ncbi:MAG: VanW family protein [Ferruginibacter sp.]
MTPPKALIEKHNLISTAIFRLKSSLLIIKRWGYNIFSTHKKFPQQSCISVPVVIAVSESDLWNNDDNEQNWILTAGKVENLRLAAKQLNGIEVEANMIFSFWKHIGNPHRWKGYVIGRELREGCIIPTIAGGLCQLSNALYDAALKAGFEIVERHRHTKIIKGSLAEQDRDATVKWNYIDLRFKSSKAFKIEVDISADKLVCNI